MIDTLYDGDIPLSAIATEHHNTDIARLIFWAIENAGLTLEFA